MTTQNEIAADSILNQVLTLKEVSEIYKVNADMVRVSIHKGYISARKSGGTWLVLRSDAHNRWSQTHLVEKVNGIIQDLQAVVNALLISAPIEDTFGSYPHALRRVKTARLDALSVMCEHRAEGLKAGLSAVVDVLYELMDGSQCHSQHVAGILADVIKDLKNIAWAIDAYEEIKIEGDDME
jgi:hypothetical protein